MLKLPERIIILYVTAPTGFSATISELRKKFKAGGEIYAAVYRLTRRRALHEQSPGQFAIGPLLREELGESV